MTIMTNHDGHGHDQSWPCFPFIKKGNIGHFSLIGDFWDWVTVSYEIADGRYFQFFDKCLQVSSGSRESTKFCLEMVPFLTLATVHNWQGKIHSMISKWFKIFPLLLERNWWCLHNPRSNGSAVIHTQDRVARLIDGLFEALDLGLWFCDSLDSLWGGMVLISNQMYRYKIWSLRSLYTDTVGQEKKTIYWYSSIS